MLLFSICSNYTRTQMRWVWVSACGTSRQLMERVAAFYYTCSYLPEYGQLDVMSEDRHPLHTAVLWCC